jgi:hypothetical protein
LATTYGYDSLLAELISGWAPTASTSPTSWTEGYLTYPVSRPILKEVLRLCAWTLVLSELHTALRWSSKDVNFEFDDAIPTPIADPTNDERAAVSLYDRRVEEGPMSFLGGMATRSAIPSSPLGTTDTESVKDPYLIAVVPIENTEVRIPLVGVRVEQRPKTLAAYSPVPVATAELAALCQSAELKDAAWPQSIPFLLQLLALLGVMFLRQPTWLVNTMQRGYFLATKSVLDQVLEETLPTLSEKLLIPTFPNLRFTRTPSDFLLGLRSIRGTDLPLIPGPIVRDAGPERLCLDLWAATARLNKDLQITEPGGSSANLRSRH